MDSQLLPTAQLDTLRYLYRFRFLNSSQLQRLLTHNNIRLTNYHLKNLITYNYIGKHYSRSLGLANLPAVYYLSSGSIKVLSDSPDFDKRALIEAGQDSKKIEVGLQIKEKEDRVVEEIDNRSSQRVLLLIDFLLRQNKLSISEIDEIRVSSGPGSFTGIKVGVSIANALGFALGVPVNGREQAKPKYE